MSTDFDHSILEDFRKQVSKRDRTIIIVGTGVTVGATKGAPTASWTGLIASGLDWCRELRWKDQAWVDRQLPHLQSNDTDELIAVAQAVSTVLGAPSHGEFRKWLRETVGILHQEPHLQDRSVLEALRDLGVQLATTNYDGLLEEITGLPPVTWRETQRVDRMFREGERGILHLHGYWDQPESVVFGSGSYDAVVAHEHIQNALRVYATLGSIVYVGFGAGLADPNFLQFREWVGRVFSGSEHRHYRLARNSEREAVQAQHSTDERVVVIPFGEDHGKLAPFLRDLIPPTEPPAEDPPDVIETPDPEDQIWSVPHPLNRDLVGREVEIDKISQGLMERGATVVQASTAIRTIHGLGGIGKTQLAVAYANRYRSDYHLVWWLRSEDQATLVSDFVILGRELGVQAEFYERQDDLIAAVRRAIEKLENRWLLIFDNATSHASIDRFVPTTPGHVLVTTRSANWPHSYQPVSLDLLSPDAAVAFLIDQTGLDDEKGALDLAVELGRLPLALAQAAAYVRRTKVSFPGYLERYQAHQAEILQRGQPDDYPATVLTTWELSFREATKTVPASEALMNLVAFMAPEVIPLDLLSRKVEGVPEAVGELLGSDLEMDDAVAALREYSLLERVNDGTLSVHRLVQVAARSRLSGEQQQIWLSAVVNIIANAFPVDAHDIRYRDDAARLLTHGNAASKLALDLDIQTASLEQLLNRIGRLLTGRASYSDAQAMFERAMTVAEQVHGVESTEVAMNFNDLAMVRRAQGKLGEGRELHERALAIREARLGSEHPDTAASLSNLAMVLQDQGKLREARELHERALAIREAQLGAEHPDTAASLGNLAVVLRNLGEKLAVEAEFLEARQLLQKALAYFRRIGADAEAQTTLRILSQVNRQEQDARQERRKRKRR